MLLYFASTKDLLTVACFLAFQESKVESRNTQNLVTNFLDIG